MKPDRPLQEPGMTERVREVARRLGLRRFWRPLPPPTNLRARDTGAEAVDRDTAYGLNTGLAYRNQMRAAGLDPADRDVLEIGPGTGFAGIAVLTAYGARGAVADRWLSPWQEDYHDRYYGRLAELLKEVDPDADVRPIKALVDMKAYEGSAIQTIPAPAEELDKSTDRRFDAIFSNAVLEHVLDIDRSLEALCGLTKTGGHGFHQVDFRDHRNFDRPLDHLLFAPEVFRAMSSRVHMEYGSQRRPEEYATAFEAAGFRIVGYYPNEVASEDYLDDLTRRLAQSPRSPCRTASREQLRDLGGLFVVRRDH